MKVLIKTNELKKLFIRNSCSQNKVADRIGVSSGYMSQIVTVQKPVGVVIPNDFKTFLLDQKMITLKQRRDLPKCIQLIQSIAHTRQYQRQVHHDGDIPYILVEQQDIDLANHLIKNIFSFQTPDLRGVSYRFLSAIQEHIGGFWNCIN